MVTVNLITVPLRRLRAPKAGFEHRHITPKTQYNCTVFLLRAGKLSLVKMKFTLEYF